jgi:Ca2+-binding RTX toxin-like protein
MSRQIVLSLAVAMAVLATAGGVALALNKTYLGAVGSGGTLAPDCVGTREADTLTAGDDNTHIIAGLEGNDIITGGGFHDTIYGDEGDGTINDNTGPGPGAADDIDVIYGDEGNDTIDVRENEAGRDIVDCGPGKKDKVFFDVGADSVTRCEIKNPGLQVPSG